MIKDEVIDDLYDLGNKLGAPEWYPGHLHNDSISCNCPYVFQEGYFGSVAEISVGNDLPISEGGNDCPPVEVAKLNQRFIALANPHNVVALIERIRDLEERFLTKNTDE